MAYIKIVDNIVVQKQSLPAEGFIEVSEPVVCGQILQEDGSFKNPEPSPKTVNEKRQEEYIAKGWKNAFDLIDDILTRGMNTVKTDRDMIKQRFPKE